MIEPSHVQADVIDFRPALSAMPSDLVLDANVLYWAFYDFTSLVYVRGGMGIPRRQPTYKAFVGRAEAAKVRFHVTTFTLGEFAKVVEYAELDAIWSTDPSLPQPDPANPVTEFSPRVCKFARYHYSARLGKVRADVGVLVSEVLKKVSLLPQFPTADDQHTNSAAEWLASLGDFPDAALVAAAKHNGIPHVLSDDSDLATFADVTLYTANDRAISAARAAGKLR